MLFRSPPPHITDHGLVEEDIIKTHQPAPVAVPAPAVPAPRSTIPISPSFPPPHVADHPHSAHPVHLPIREGSPGTPGVAPVPPKLMESPPPAVTAGYSFAVNTDVPNLFSQVGADGTAYRQDVAAAEPVTPSRSSKRGSRSSSHREGNGWWGWLRNVVDGVNEKIFGLFGGGRR